METLGICELVGTFILLLDKITILVNSFKMGGIISIFGKEFRLQTTVIPVETR